MAVVRRVGLVLLFVVVWVSLLRPPWPAAAFELDQSWAQAYGQALKTNLRFGVDLVFTFGPLGYFYRPSYDPDLYRFALWFELLLKGLMAWALFGAWRLITLPVARFCYYALLLLLVSGASDAPYFLASLALVLRVARPSSGISTLFVATPLLAVFALTKFSFLVFSLLSVAALALVLWRRSRLAGLFAVVSFAGWFLCGWSLAGQSVVDLPAYLRESIQIAAGYSAAMSIWGPRPELVCALLGIGGCLLLLWFHARSGADRFSRVVVASLCAAGLLVSFKAGFVTQDVHVMTTFGVVGALALLLGRPAALRRGPALTYSLLLILVVGASLAGASISKGGGRLSAEPVVRWWDRFRTAAHQYRWPATSGKGHKRHLWRREEEFALPEVRAAVGSETIDIIDWEQGILFLNRLNWRPRPVLHGYMTYTPALMERNGAHFAGDGAPRFVLFQVQPRADWLPTMADAAALEVICRDYWPLFLERQYLLLERQPRRDLSLPTSLPPTRQGIIEFDEDVPVAAGAGRSAHLALDLELSVEGRLRAFLYKPPPVFITLVHGAGAVEQFRIVPGMMHGGVLISPSIRTTNEFQHYLLGTELAEVVALRVEVSPGGAASYRSDIGMKLWISERAKRD